ncbi:MAG TPA: ferrochelatase [Caulobacteraceae bacterium]|jgi:ferrochelatase|nr:ferrochelatase [Caulobacteraceae bacterium]
MSERRIAVVLFNLGGPDGPADVTPFLFNLFSDRAIIDQPGAVRVPLAALIAGARGRRARANYAVMGGGSPLLAGTTAQARALEAALSERLGPGRVKVFIAMRYWAPRSASTAAEVAAFIPDEVVLAPLYPQYSTTTTASSLRAWKAAYEGPGAVHGLCCWYDAAGLAEAHAHAIRETWEEAGRPKVRVLFSAHGLPVATANRGDPYAWQVEVTSAAIAARLGPDWDWQVCYQSRVGPMKWLGPSTPEAIAAAAREDVGVLIDPVSFVSEHVETLVELDRDYARLARQAGAPCYLRVPALGVAAGFIEALASAVERALARPGLGPDGRPCPARFSRCGREIPA